MPVIERGIAMAKEEFAARLRELREGRGWTQAELALKVGVSADSVAQWERARCEPTWSHAVALADALGVPIEAFRQAPAVLPPRRKAGRPRKPTPPAEPPAAEPSGGKRSRRKKGG
jgi:transcriptional regulator with XRE-family HTH domain